MFKDQKLFCRKKIGFKKILYLAFGPLSVDRPVDRRQSKIALSVDWAVNRHVPKYICAPWSTGQSTDCKSFALGPIDRPGRPTESLALWLGKTVDPVDRYPQRSEIRPLAVDRQKIFLLYFSQWPESKIWPLAVNQPVDRQKDFLLDFFPTAIFCFVFFWAFFQRLFWVFSSYFHPL